MFIIFIYNNEFEVNWYIIESKLYLYEMKCEIVI